MEGVPNGDAHLGGKKLTHQTGLKNYVDPVEDDSRTHGIRGLAGLLKYFHLLDREIKWEWVSMEICLLSGVIHLVRTQP